MNRLRRLLVPTTLTCALLTALAFAATASAEMRLGEATSSENSALAGELDLLAASARYDSTAGTVAISATTREAPGNNKKAVLVGGLFPVSGACSYTDAETLLNEALYPRFSIVAPYSAETAPAAWSNQGKEGEAPDPENSGPAAKAVVATETFVTATTPMAVEKPFNCVLVGVSEGGSPVDYVIFPLLPESTLRPSNTTRPQSVPALAPAALSFGRSKPVTAKSGRWTKVKVKVANTGGTAVGPIAFKAKAPKGVIVRPASPKLPALLGGQTWTVNLQVKLTEKAKSKSTITITGNSGALTATGSVVVRSGGGRPRGPRPAA